MIVEEEKGGIFSKLKNGMFGDASIRNARKEVVGSFSAPPKSHSMFPSKTIENKLGSNFTVTLPQTNATVLPLPNSASGLKGVKEAQISPRFGKLLDLLIAQLSTANTKEGSNSENSEKKSKKFTNLARNFVIFVVAMKIIGIFGMMFWKPPKAVALNQTFSSVSEQIPTNSSAPVEAEEKPKEGLRGTAYE